MSSSQLSVTPGKSITLTYKFSNAVKTATDEWVFVHFVNGNGNIEFQDTHFPSVPTTQWTGSMSLTRTITVPSTALGTYRIWIGIYNQTTGVRQVLKPGAGVSVTGDNRYQIGVMHVEANFLVNGGFESGWASWEDGGNTSLVSGVGQTGTYAARTGTGEGGVAQEVTRRVLVGSTYQIRGRARMTAVTEETWLGVEFENSSGQVIARRGALINSTSFATYTVSFTVPAGTAKTFITWWKAPGSSHALIDDISVVPMTAP